MFMISASDGGGDGDGDGGGNGCIICSSWSGCTSPGTVIRGGASCTCTIGLWSKGVNIDNGVSVVGAFIGCCSDDEAAACCNTLSVVVELVEVVAEGVVGTDCGIEGGSRARSGRGDRHAGEPNGGWNVGGNSGGSGNDDGSTSGSNGCVELFGD